ncbi:hypothetical protein [Flexibacterium corallicola]|uniref:hypothetical protein n=1 Tax=Flexibacterium corallicola TaxID=3037259 RepID=UPI00286EEA40|nr:hypothetical protein [Pseudovibrio sp. M1P-2-3]
MFLIFFVVALILAVSLSLKIRRYTLPQVDDYREAIEPMVIKSLEEQGWSPLSSVDLTTEGSTRSLRFSYPQCNSIAFVTILSPDASGAELLPSYLNRETQTYLGNEKVNEFLTLRFQIANFVQLLSHAVRGETAQFIPMFSVYFPKAEGCPQPKTIWRAK